MTGAQFLANNAGQLMLEVAMQIDAGLAKDKTIAEQAARIAELEAALATLKAPPSDEP